MSKAYPSSAFSVSVGVVKLFRRNTKLSAQLTSPKILLVHQPV